MKNYFRFVVFALLGLLNAQWASAQNVTIRSNNGSTIAAVKEGDTDTFFGCGGFATWQHEQLNMVLTVSDGTRLTPSGQLDNPANNLFSDGTMMQVAKGRSSTANVCYITVSLPSGYRFTQYIVKFSKPGQVTKGSGNGAITFNTANESSEFGETNSTFTSYMPASSDEFPTYASVSRGGSAEIISRTEQNGDMGNVLYFRLQNPSDSRAIITLESAEFFFTSEENYSPVTPAVPITSAVSAVDIPFTTSKVDYGAVENRSYTIDGRTYSRMSYSSADLRDLQANFVLYEAESVKDGTDIDGVTGGKVVDYKAGSITSAGGYFKLGNSSKEQVYYIETPTYVTLSNGTKNPVGYRIIEAEFEYTKSVNADNSHFFITCIINGTTYYLNTYGRFTTTPVIWEIDSDGYISSNGRYLYWNNNYVSTQIEKPVQTGRFTIGSNGRIYMSYYTSYYIRGYYYNGTIYGLVTNNNYGEYATTISSPGANVDNFTLKVYDEAGENPETINVTGYGKKKITGLNNDAVKFGVQGIGLVRAKLTLQALDPYLKSMDVVCQDENPQKPIRLSQGFTASDFSVNGGEFHFYLPSDCAGDNVAITFEELKSDYLDDTYTGGSAQNTSRINFVKSLHYNAFGASNNNIYTNVGEAKNAQLERQKVSVVGTKPFKFNNAAEVGSSGGTLTEYPFSLEKYAATPNSGNFTDMKFTVSTTQQSLTRYVFTTDETRYNIAPATATQHRAYAFYQMIVHVQTLTYSPKVEFTKIYDHTLYGTGQDKVFYGAKVTAYDSNTPPKAGYASTTAIFDVINTAITRGSDDFGHACSDLKDPSQLLYLDFSEMAGIYQTTTDTHGSMEDFAATNAKNCMIFIPKGASAPNNNVCAKTEAGTFLAANNIVLTDKEPFYSPYDIQLSPQKYIEYKRLVTTDKYGKVQNASLILPFSVTLDGNGKHTNADGSSFSLHTMQAGQTLQIKDGQLVAYFPAMEDVTLAAANTPYLVKIDGNSDGEGNENVTFTVSQTGGTIAKTKDAGMAADYTFSGAAVTDVTAGGTSEGHGKFTFTPKGTYAGQQVAKGENIFYFAQNMFVNSKDYKYDKVNVAPFRAYFATPTAGAKLASFMPVFEEVDGDVTAIAPVEAFIDVEAPVYDMQGRMVATSYREAKSLKRGMYVVKGVKIVVK